jgi:hypothetical protein
MIPTYRDTGEPLYTDDKDIAAWYDSQGRHGFESYAAMRQAWDVYGEELMAEDPGSWWAWRQWSQVKVSDLVGVDDAT